MQKKIKYFILIAILIFEGCIGLHRASVKKANVYATKSERFYKKAIREYEKALDSSSKPDLIRHKLGNLYYQHGDYAKAINFLSGLEDIPSQKILAYSYYKIGSYTDALAIFNKLDELKDDEYLYFYAQTCERQNLFDQAKSLYEKIESLPFLSLAQERLLSIESLIKESILEPAIQRIIAQAPTQADLPQAGAAILLSDEKVDILPDNTAIFEEHFLIKVLNERGKKFAEVEIGYDSTYEKVELIYAHTIKPNGEIIPVGAKHIRDVSKYFNYPLYSNARAMIISMPEVTIDAFIEYKVKIKRSRLIDKKEFRLAYFLQEDEPIVYAKMTVNLPIKKKLNMLVINEEFNYLKVDLNPKIIEEGDRETYIWEFKDIPQIIPEPSMPPKAEITPIILLSTFDSWQHIYRWWWDLAKDKIKVDEQIKNKVRELTKGKKTAKEKAQAIYNWCAQDIRYVAIEYGQAGYEPHYATEIFKNKYGDCKDQSILLISMLKEAGIKAYPVLIGTKDYLKLQEDFPSPLFNHCIAVVKIGEELIFLDPTGETTSFGDLPQGDEDRKVFVFFEDRGEILSTPSFPAKHNRVDIKTNIKINPDETIYAEREVSTFGFYDQAQRWRFKYTMPVLIEDSLKNKIQELSSGGELINYRIENVEDMNKPTKLFYRFKGSEFLSKAGDARVILPLGSLDTSLVIKDERSYPIDFVNLDGHRDIIEIELPDNLQLKFMPETISYNTQWVDFLNQYDFQDQKIIFIQETRTKVKTISKEEYQDFKNFLEEASQRINQCVVLEKTQQAQTKYIDEK